MFPGAEFEDANREPGEQARTWVQTGTRGYCSESEEFWVGVPYGDVVDWYRKRFGETGERLRDAVFGKRMETWEASKNRERQVMVKVIQPLGADGEAVDGVTEIMFEDREFLDSSYDCVTTFVINED